MEMYQEINKELKSKYKSNREVNWVYISINNKLSESFIERYQDKIVWNLISQYQVLSESFIEKFQDKVSWYYISNYQKLSEPFIEKFQDELGWENISKCQVLSESFIERNIDKIDLMEILSHQRLSERFIKKYIKREEFDFYRLFLIANTLFMSDIGKDWFIAYIDGKKFKDYFNFYSSNKTIPRLKYKVKIYYKDLITTTTARKYYKLRKIRRYKICGKKNGSI